ncbi:MAG TPA: hypothetical protein VLF91_02800 [Candidatus Saccharimonadales bacterium]|nr:hypothetical protein [Candidatus Saccharimonadales bacterium]
MAYHLHYATRIVSQLADTISNSPNVSLARLHIAPTGQRQKNGCFVGAHYFLDIYVFATSSA